MSFVAGLSGILSGELRMFRQNWTIDAVGANVTDHSLAAGLTVSGEASDAVHQSGSRLSLACAVINTNYYLTRTALTALPAGLYSVSVEVDPRYATYELYHSFDGVAWVSDELYATESNEPLLHNLRGSFLLHTPGPVYFRLRISAPALVTPPRISSHGWELFGLVAA